MIAAALLIALGVLYATTELSPTSSTLVCDGLAKRRVVRVLAPDEVSLRCEGVVVEAPERALIQALASTDATALGALLRARKGSAIAVQPRVISASAGTLLEQLARLAYVPGLRAVVLGPELAVYAPERELALSNEERDAVAFVARALLRGAREPSVSSFPAALRRVERVEVLVMLSRQGEPRLWRSARGTSIARALLTATRVARDRWREREQAMGGPLAKRLLELDVEVSLLSDDGTLTNTQSLFVDRSVGPSHGLGFDHRTAWHYLLPRDVAAAKRGAFAALSGQIAEQGLTLSILGESDTRVYRFVALPLGVSKAPLPSAAEQLE
jgi:hypothetical protein